MANLRLHLHVHARNARFGKESKSMGQPAQEQAEQGKAVLIHVHDIVA